MLESLYRCRLPCLLLSTATFFALDANAGTLVIEDSTILGIDDVQLGDRLYDVEFVDGACIDLFTGCDGASDFPFNGSRDDGDLESAVAASLAIQSVLHPPGIGILARPAGCDALATCEMLTPTFAEGAVAGASITFPDPGRIGTIPLLQFFDPLDDLGQDPFAVYARWTLIPEPSVAVLLGLGLCGLRSLTVKRS